MRFSTSLKVYLTFDQRSRSTSTSSPDSFLTYIRVPSSSNPMTIPRVPFTQRWSISFLIKITCAPTFSSSCIGVGIIVSGKSPFVAPLRVTGSPGSSSRCWVLMKSTVSRVVERVIARLSFWSNPDCPEVTLALSRERSLSVACEVRILSRIPIKTGSDCL